MPLGTADNFENWIYDEHSAAVIEKLMRTSAVEAFGSHIPMAAAVKSVLRDGGFTVGSVAKCGTYGESPDWSTGKADFDNPKIGVNARLFDDFDLDAVEVVTIDGKNLW